MTTLTDQEKRERANIACRKWRANNREKNRLYNIEYFRARRANPRTLCECGQRSTIYFNGALQCARCAELDGARIKAETGRARVGSDLRGGLTEYKFYTPGRAALSI